MYDIAVCGAGAVGSYLARTFSEKWKTLLIEDNSQIGFPIACSGLYSKRLLEFMDLKKELIENEIKGANIHAGGKTYFFSRGKTEAYVVKRDFLDSHLASEAEKRGCTVVTSTRLTDYSIGNKIKLKLLSRGKEKTEEARVLAGCDGPLSLVRRKAGLEEPREMLQGIFCYAQEEDYSQLVDLWFGPVPGFFAWRIPRGKTVEYGIATRENAKQVFEKFIKERNVKIKNMYGGLIPIGPPKRIISDSVFLCGDSAAMTKPFTGGGIIYGFASAKIAYDTIIPGEQSSLEKYQREWERTLRKEIQIGLMLKRGYSLPASLHRLILGALERKQKTLDMDMPSSIFN